ncbi:MAG: quinol:cytochrome C oxidoreductase [Crocinitomicaceae bacterium]|nr:quinol:cytochrome C oxidoreductase [Crocinitomicaceae bacterium]
MSFGVIALVYGIFLAVSDVDGAHHSGTRLWTNLLINGFFFMGIAASAMFFFAVNYAAESGWWVVIKRILEAVGSFLPVGSLVLFIVLFAGVAHQHHIWHWMDAEAVAADEVLRGKAPYLNWMFMAARQLIILGAWIFMWTRFRKRSLEEDLGFERNRHFKNVRDAAIFLIIFGYPISTFVPWDWIMSIDAHWFSTLFGWYVFSGLWLSSLVVTTLMVIWLKKQGYMKDVNASHIQDLGKWVFGVSFLWAYLFFSQFMLIWYSNIPEEVTYFQVRFEEYKYLYWSMFFVNFAFPMIALMDRDSKRNFRSLTVIGILIFIGHWVDTYMLITPATMKTHSTIGIVEIGLGLGFLGLFLFVVLNTLTKAPLMAKNHPFFEESVHHEIH